MSEVDRLFFCDIMNSSITSATYIRNISLTVRRKVSYFLDPQDKWKDVIVSIRDENGGLRYSQHHVRRFECLVREGKSPTIELLNDWGTTNSTVGELVEILKNQKLLAAASVLLPEETPSVETRQDSDAIERASILPTRLLEDPEEHSQPVHSVLQELTPLVNHKSSFSSFSYSELMKITGNFDDRPMSDGGSRLGEGGFGTVYKGLLNNKPVAVKKLNAMDSISLDELQVQFEQEIQTLQMLKHKNLVDMIGFSCEGQHPCLVYAFMANGSLLDRLACLDESPPLSWCQRCLIVMGTARGLEYLHSNHHVHRDIKSANILLDENFAAKISDFGLTRASAKHSSTTMMTGRIVGTSAYMAPEALRGEITPKSDIFSFGVVLLEILSGLPPADEKREPQFLMDLRHDIDDEDEELTLEDFLDKKMRDWEMGQVETIYSLACSCLHDRKNRRPVITQVVSELKDVIKSIGADFQAED
ncbi:interleukin-1 receptor-associated kinase 4 isoform X2 [Sphaeramia orbicularis]|uniref:interleukin-1 receptor-associated kinase 4 isoform X2 n=1 Tax=Sphaeramia orbicularis TaxID=375764 RepID=UPI00117C7898|nr:interleukin-1 receptor-associated kinase 4 isoform X2 [Sphaeramia orbicularis]